MQLKEAGALAGLEIALRARVTSETGPGKRGVLAIPIARNRVPCPFAPLREGAFSCRHHGNDAFPAVIPVDDRRFITRRARERKLMLLKT